MGCSTSAEVNKPSILTIAGGFGGQQEPEALKKLNSWIQESRLLSYQISQSQASGRRNQESSKNSEESIIFFSSPFSFIAVSLSGLVRIIFKGELKRSHQLQLPPDQAQSTFVSIDCSATHYYFMLSSLNALYVAPIKGSAQPRILLPINSQVPFDIRMPVLPKPLNLGLGQQLLSVLFSKSNHPYQNESIETSIRLINLTHPIEGGESFTDINLLQTNKAGFIEKFIHHITVGEHRDHLLALKSTGDIYVYNLSLEQNSGKPLHRQSQVYTDIKIQKDRRAGEAIIDLQWRKGSEFVWVISVDKALNLHSAYILKLSDSRLSLRRNIDLRASGLAGYTTSISLARKVVGNVEVLGVVNLSSNGVAQNQRKLNFIAFLNENNSLYLLGGSTKVLEGFGQYNQLSCNGIGRVCYSSSNGSSEELNINYLDLN